MHMIKMSQPLSGFTLHFQSITRVYKVSQDTTQCHKVLTRARIVSQVIIKCHCFKSVICARATRLSLQVLIAGPHQKRGIYIFLYKIRAISSSKRSTK